MLRALVLLCAAPLAAGSALFWVSEPTLPGETLLIGGACGSKVELRQGGSSATWTAAPLVPSGTTPYGCAVQLPATFAAGEFQVRSDGGAALTGNVARPWFVFGDAGDSATSGGTGWMRVVGEALALERGAAPSAVLILEQKGTVVATLHQEKAAAPGLGAPTRWHAAFSVPATLSPGQCKKRP